MGDSLKDLLQAETEAEAIVARGEKERDANVQQSLDDSLELEKQFQARLPEIYQSFLEKAQERADQSIAEMKLRYDEHNKELRILADKHEKEALENAITLILGDGQFNS